jgi:ABC-type bacteriocin/lantibiotic exporter with double-glycine peptidase domain
LNYILIRLGMFIVFLTVLLLVKVEPVLAALIAAALSLIVSLVFLRNQRDAVSRVISSRVDRKSGEPLADAESDLENRLLDEGNDPK